MKNDAYLQFELCLLRFQGADKDCVIRIVDRAISLFTRQMAPADVEALPKGITFPSDFQAKNRAHRAAVLTAHRLRINLGSMKRHFSMAADAEEYVNLFAKIDGKDALVRIRADYPP